MSISIVVAISENNAIGKDNQLLWHLPADLKHFKTVTTGHTVLMGRKTYDSIGKPLPNRRNIVISRQDIHINGCEVVDSLESALDLCTPAEEVMIIGGAEIYRQALTLANRIYLTKVHYRFGADTFFPELNMADWTITAEESFEADEKNPFAYTFLTLERH